MADENVDSISLRYSKNLKYFYIVWILQILMPFNKYIYFLPMLQCALIVTLVTVFKKILSLIKIPKSEIFPGLDFLINIQSVVITIKMKD